MVFVFFLAGFFLACHYLLYTRRKNQRPKYKSICTGECGPTFNAVTKTWSHSCAETVPLDTCPACLDIYQVENSCCVQPPRQRDYCNLCGQRFRVGIPMPDQWFWTHRKWGWCMTCSDWHCAMCAYNGKCADFSRGF